jgi:prophage regulatory protein
MAGDDYLNKAYWDSRDLHTHTGTPASTWRYWHKIGEGPPGFKLGKRLVWKRAAVLKWPAQQEKSR